MMAWSLLLCFSFFTVLGSSNSLKEGFQPLFPQTFGYEHKIVPNHHHVKHHELLNRVSSVTDVQVPKQWLAWYFKSCLPTGNGFQKMFSRWEVPSVPTANSNLAIFNGLQATPDGSSYNFILQPVLSRGEWMLGSSSGWQMSSVMCGATGHCLWTKPVATTPGHIIEGTISLLNVPNSDTDTYIFMVNITDVTAQTAPAVLKFSTKYFAPWSYTALEHNPQGPLSSCGQLPSQTNITFYDNFLQPKSIDMWQGAQNDLSCKLKIDTFPSDGGRLVITL